MLVESCRAVAGVFLSVFDGHLDVLKFIYIVYGLTPSSLCGLLLDFRIQAGRRLFDQLDEERVRGKP